MYDLFVRFIADYLVVIIVIIASFMLVFKIPRGKRLKAYKRILLAGLTSYMIAKFAAFIYQPTDLRPFEILGLKPGAAYLNNPGFPSDHALFVTVLTLAVWFETKNKLVSSFLAVGVLLVCVGRVLALVHSPVDVIFGVFIGLAGALWYLDDKKIGKRK
jgi:membrane-associated phospholipid phosphatase